MKLLKFWEYLLNITTLQSIGETFVLAILMGSGTSQVVRLPRGKVGLVAKKYLQADEKCYEERQHQSRRRANKISMILKACEVIKSILAVKVADAVGRIKHFDQPVLVDSTFLRAKYFCEPGAFAFDGPKINDRRHRFIWDALSLETPFAEVARELLQLKYIFSYVEDPNPDESYPLQLEIRIQPSKKVARDRSDSSSNKI